MPACAGCLLDSADRHGGHRSESMGEVPGLQRHLLIGQRHRANQQELPPATSRDGRGGGGLLCQRSRQRSSSGSPVKGPSDAHRPVAGVALPVRSMASIDRRLPLWTVVVIHTIEWFRTPTIQRVRGLDSQHNNRNVAIEAGGVGSSRSVDGLVVEPTGLGQLLLGPAPIQTQGGDAMAEPRPVLRKMRMDRRHGHGSNVDTCRRASPHQR